MPMRALLPAIRRAISVRHTRPTRCGPLRGRGRLRFFFLFDLEDLDGHDRRDLHRTLSSASAQRVKVNDSHRVFLAPEPCVAVEPISSGRKLGMLNSSGQNPCEGEAGLNGRTLLKRTDLGDSFQSAAQQVDL